MQATYCLTLWFECTEVVVAAEVAASVEVAISGVDEAVSVEGCESEEGSGVGVRAGSSIGVEVEADVDVDVDAPWISEPATPSVATGSVEVPSADI